MQNAQYPEKTYNDLKRQILGLGYICMGSIAPPRTLPCGKPACSCHGDRSKWHGPYRYWTRKIDGRTETKYLKKTQVASFDKAIETHQELNGILEQMREVSLLAIQET